MFLKSRTLEKKTDKPEGDKDNSTKRPLPPLRCASFVHDQFCVARSRPLDSDSRRLPDG